MKSLLLQILALAEKDIRLELRTRSALFATSLFVVLVLLILNLSFGPEVRQSPAVAAGVLWVVIIFAGSIALSHLSSREYEDRVHDGLLMTGCSGVVLFAARFLIALFFMWGIALLTVPLFILFFNYPLGSWIPMFGMIFGLGSIGYAAVGTLFSAMVSQARLRELLLVIMFYPVIIPLLIPAVRATASLMGGELPKEGPFLLGFDIVFVSASALLYEFVVEDSA